MNHQEIINKNFNLHKLHPLVQLFLLPFIEPFQLNGECPFYNQKLSIDYKKNFSQLSAIEISANFNSAIGELHLLGAPIQFQENTFQSFLQKFFTSQHPVPNEMEICFALYNIVTILASVKNLYSKIIDYFPPLISIIQYNSNQYLDSIGKFVLHSLFDAVISDKDITWDEHFILRLLQAFSMKMTDSSFMPEFIFIFQKSKLINKDDLYDTIVSSMSAFLTLECSQSIKEEEVVKTITLIHAYIQALNFSAISILATFSNDQKFAKSLSPIFRELHLYFFKKICSSPPILHFDATTTVTLPTTLQDKEIISPYSFVNCQSFKNGFSDLNIEKSKDFSTITSPLRAYIDSLASQIKDSSQILLSAFFNGFKQFFEFAENHYTEDIAHPPEFPNDQSFDNVFKSSDFNSIFAHQTNPYFLDFFISFIYFYERLPYKDSNNLFESFFPSIIFSDEHTIFQPGSLDELRSFLRNIILEKLMNSPNPPIDDYLHMMKKSPLLIAESLLRWQKISNPQFIKAFISDPSFQVIEQESHFLQSLDLFHHSDVIEKARNAIFLFVFHISKEEPKSCFTNCIFLHYMSHYLFEHNLTNIFLTYLFKIETHLYSKIEKISTYEFDWNPFHDFLIDIFHAYSLNPNEENSLNLTLKFLNLIHELIKTQNATANGNLNQPQWKLSRLDGLNLLNDIIKKISKIEIPYEFFIALYKLLLLVSSNRNNLILNSLCFYTFQHYISKYDDDYVFYLSKCLLSNLSLSFTSKFFYILRPCFIPLLLFSYGNSSRLEMLLELFLSISKESEFNVRALHEGQFDLLLIQALLQPRSLISWNGNFFSINVINPKLVFNLILQIQKYSTSFCVTNQLLDLCIASPQYINDFSNTILDSKQYNVMSLGTYGPIFQLTNINPQLIDPNPTICFGFKFDVNAFYASNATINLLKIYNANCSFSIVLSNQGTWGIIEYSNKRFMVNIGKRINGLIWMNASIRFHSKGNVSIISPIYNSNKANDAQFIPLNFSNQPLTIEIGGIHTSIQNESHYCLSDEWKNKSFITISPIYIFKNMSNNPNGKNITESTILEENNYDLTPEQLEDYGLSLIVGSKHSDYSIKIKRNTLIAYLKDPKLLEKIASNPILLPVLNTIFHLRPKCQDLFSMYFMDIFNQSLRKDSFKMTYKSYLSLISLVDSFNSSKSDLIRMWLDKILLNILIWGRADLSESIKIVSSINHIIVRYSSYLKDEKLIQRFLTVFVEMFTEPKRARKLDSFFSFPRSSLVSIETLEEQLKIKFQQLLIHLVRIQNQPIDPTPFFCYLSHCVSSSDQLALLEIIRDCAPHFIFDINLMKYLEIFLFNDISKFPKQVLVAIESLYTYLDANTQQNKLSNNGNNSSNINITNNENSNSPNGFNSSNSPRSSNNNSDISTQEEKKDARLRSTFVKKIDFRPNFDSSKFLKNENQIPDFDTLSLTILCDLTIKMNSNSNQNYQDMNLIIFKRLLSAMEFRPCLYSLVCGLSLTLKNEECKKTAIALSSIKEHFNGKLWYIWPLFLCFRVGNHEQEAIISFIIKNIFHSDDPPNQIKIISYFMIYLTEFVENYPNTNLSNSVKPSSTNENQFEEYKKINCQKGNKKSETLTENSHSKIISGQVTETNDKNPKLVLLKSFTKKAPKTSRSLITLFFSKLLISIFSSSTFSPTASQFTSSLKFRIIDAIVDGIGKSFLFKINFQCHEQNLLNLLCENPDISGFSDYQPRFRVLKHLFLESTLSIYNFSHLFSNLKEKCNLFCCSLNISSRSTSDGIQFLSSYISAILNTYESRQESDRNIEFENSYKILNFLNHVSKKMSYIQSEKQDEFQGKQLTQLIDEEKKKFINEMELTISSEIQTLNKKISESTYKEENALSQFQEIMHLHQNYQQEQFQNVVTFMSQKHSDFRSAQIHNYTIPDLTVCQHCCPFRTTLLTTYSLQLSEIIRAYSFLETNISPNLYYDENPIETSQMARFNPNFLDFENHMFTVHWITPYSPLLFRPISYNYIINESAQFLFPSSSDEVQLSANRHLHPDSIILYWKRDGKIFNKLISIESIAKAIFHQTNGIELITYDGDDILIDVSPYGSSYFYSEVLRLPSSLVIHRKAAYKVLKEWQNGKISNFNFLMKLNLLSARSFQSVDHYPLLPLFVNCDHLPITPSFKSITPPKPFHNSNLNDDCFSKELIPPEYYFKSEYLKSEDFEDICHFLSYSNPTLFQKQGKFSSENLSNLKNIFDIRFYFVHEMRRILESEQVTGMIPSFIDKVFGNGLTTNVFSNRTIHKQLFKFPISRKVSNTKLDKPNWTDCNLGQTISNAFFLNPENLAIISSNNFKLYHLQMDQIQNGATLNSKMKVDISGKCCMKSFGDHLEHLAIIDQELSLLKIITNEGYIIQEQLIENTKILSSDGPFLLYCPTSTSAQIAKLVFYQNEQKEDKMQIQVSFNKIGKPIEVGSIITCGALNQRFGTVVLGTLDGNVEIRGFGGGSADWREIKPFVAKLDNSIEIPKYILITPEWGYIVFATESSLYTLNINGLLVSRSKKQVKKLMAFTHKSGFDWIFALDGKGKILYYFEPLFLDNLSAIRLKGKTISMSYSSRYGYFVTVTNNGYVFLYQAHVN